MLFVRKSITRKFLVFVFLVSLLVSAGIGYFYSIGVETFSWRVLLGVYFGSLIVVLFGFYSFFARPMAAILRQMRLLLTGRAYHKFLTQRIDEIGVLALFFNEVTRNFEKVSRQLKEGEKMQSEMQTASQIQRDVLPPEIPSIPGLDVVAKTRFADELGGDCFGFINNSSRSLIYIGDVTGHGLPAALVMMMVSTFLSTYAEISPNALDVVVNTNRQLKPRIKATMFMTMLLLAWDRVGQKMTFVGAGHEYLFVYRAKLLTVEKIPAGGIALGMVPDNSSLVKEIDLKLEVGDVILLFSDGITEARNDLGEMFGEDRLEALFKEYAAMYGASGVLYHIARAFGDFTGEHVQEDDMTMICVKYTGEQVVDEANREKSILWETEKKV